MLISFSSLNPQDVSTSIPKQETLLSLAVDSLFWNEMDVVQATDNFNQTHKISEGTFADIYRGQRQGIPFVFKKLREVSTWFVVCVLGEAAWVRQDFNVLESFPTDGLLRSRIN